MIEQTTLTEVFAKTRQANDCKAWVLSNLPTVEHFKFAMGELAKLKDSEDKFEVMLKLSNDERAEKYTANDLDQLEVYRTLKRWKSELSKLTKTTTPKSDYDKATSLLAKGEFSVEELEAIAAQAKLKAAQR